MHGNRMRSVLPVFTNQLERSLLHCPQFRIHTIPSVLALTMDTALFNRGESIRARLLQLRDSL